MLPHAAYRSVIPVLYGNNQHPTAHHTLHALTRDLPGITWEFFDVREDGWPLFTVTGPGLSLWQLHDRLAGPRGAWRAHLARSVHPAH